MKNKSLLWIVLVAILAAGGVYWYMQNGENSTNDNNNEQVIKIGADLTLSGAISSWSSDIKRGMDLFANEHNKYHAKKVEIFYEDNAGKAPNAINIFKKLATIDKVDVVVSAHTPIGQALRDVADQNKTPLVATVTSVSNFADGYEYVHRDFPIQSNLCPAIADYAYNKMSLKKGGFLVVNDDFGRDGIREFKKKFKQLGGSILTGEHFEQKQNDMKNQVYKVLEDKPDFIFMVGRDMSLVTCVKQIREVNKDVKIIGVIGFDSRTFWENIGQDGEGIVYSSSYVDYNDDSSKKFYNTFKQQFNKEPNYLNIYGYTIADYLTNSIASLTSEETLNQKLQNMDFNSIRGRLKANSDKDIISPIGIYKREGNKSILIEKIEF